MRIDDGFATLITFKNHATVKFWEKEVTPPSIEAGGANDTTNMHNTTWRTKAPKKLKSLGESSAKVSYDPAVYADIPDMVGENQEITSTCADGSKIEFWGWIDTFNPGSCTEGNVPTADIKIICSNQNATGAETAPVYTAAPVGP